MIPLTHSLLIATLLFCIGLAVVLIRRDLLFVLMGLEIMFTAAGLTFIAAGQYWGSADGQVMALFLIAVTAAELAVALILVWLAYQNQKAYRVDQLQQLRDEKSDGVV